METLKKLIKNPMTLKFILVVIVLLIIRSLFIRRNNLIIESVVGSTITDQQANAFANGLYTAMAQLGTDEESIQNIFAQLKTQANYNKVSNAFGQRGYNITTGLGDDLLFNTPFNLGQWLRYELSSTEIQKLTTLFPNITF